MTNSITEIQYTHNGVVLSADVFGNYKDAVNFISDNHGEPETIETVGNSIVLSSHDTIESEWFKIYVAVRPFSFRYYFAVKQ